MSDRRESGDESKRPMDTYPPCRLCENGADAAVAAATPSDEHAGHEGHDGHEPGGEGGTRETHGEHDGHGAHTEHSGHEVMFRRRFWVCLVLSIPVIVFSEFVQDVLGYTAPAVSGSEWITPVLAVVVFAYGGVPFLLMARTEVENRESGMMLLISLAITVAFGYSLASLVVPGTTPFFWELVTLVDVMLLGHWVEMRSVRRASGALDELASLVLDTASASLSPARRRTCRCRTSAWATSCSSDRARASPPMARSLREP